MKKKLTLVLAALLTMTMVIGLAGCSSNNNTAKTEKLEPGSNGEIIMATTTSTQDSGLLDVLLPKFEEETGIAVKVVAVGTGKAIEMGKNGEADVRVRVGTWIVQVHVEHTSIRGVVPVATTDRQTL